MGETDWVAAEDFLNCIKWYLNEVGIELKDIETMSELPDDKLDSMEIIYEDEEENKTFR